MTYRHEYWAVTVCICMMTLTGWAATDVAPAVPDLNLPVEEEPSQQQVQAPVVMEPAAEAPQPVAEPAPAPKKAPRPAGRKTAKNRPPKPAPAPQPAPAMQPQEPEIMAPIPQEENAAKDFVPARDTQEPAAAEQEQTTKIAYLPSTDRDPTLSPADLRLIKYREMERLRAIEAEKQRRLEAERQRLAELERLRQLELERMRDPSKEIRGRIRVNGIIGQEVFIGNKVYTVGKTVLGAKIVRVQPDAVTFMYKGQKFIKKVQLK